MIKLIVTSIICLAFGTAKASDTSIIKKYTPEQVKYDLGYMVRVMDEVHPNLYHDIGKSTFLKKYDSVLNSITGNMTAIEAWPKFATIIGAVNEGHTSIQSPQEFQNRSFTFFPLNLKEFDGEAFVVRFDASDEQQLKSGDRVLSINGFPAHSLLNQFSTYVGGLPSYEKLVVSYLLGDFLAIHQFSDPFTITYKSDGQEKTITLKGQPKSKLNERAMAYRKANSLSAYTYKTLEDDIGYLNFRSMSNPSRFSVFIDSVFSEIKKSPVKGLIVDLRQNGGGNSELGDKLLEYITDKKYRLSAGSQWKISQPYKDYYNKLPRDQQFMKDKPMEKRYLKGKNQSFIKLTSDEKKPADQPLRFSGTVCFLIAPNTFSSANMLANAIKDYQLATLIGEPTGEVPNDFGEVITLQLPHTGISFFTSTKQFIRANGKADDRNPIMPDFFIKDNPSTTLDEGLEFAKDWIRKENDKKKQ